MGTQNFSSEASERQIDMILAHIAQHGEISGYSVEVLLGISHSTACAYLRHIWQELRLIRPLEPDEVAWGKSIKRYAPGADPALPTPDLDVFNRPRSPAVQVGMWRDGLVAALFGAAGGVVA